MNLRIVKLSLLSLIALAGCEEKTTNDGDVIACTEEFSPALRINVFDKETGFPNACGATVKVQDGDFVEELTNEAGESCTENFTFSVAGERKGTYDITVIKEDHINWVQYDTVVTANICHVNTISVQAYMDK
ncbi:hypothetical protein CXF85_15375 [Colwellia sp. 75C3]|uniref:hypothetical protein n=1 Tax=Colwellia sp. 75C3 TaxID=888425 RepID=UPI000C336CF6|nr:hypothetical protein [Colwellia sp. 75C3]PKG81916.1 hypothetical protein CXF85_15375 [Colwellia sp. 75C3]